MTMRTDNTELVERLFDEADLCRNDGADDVADLLSEAVVEALREAAQAILARAGTTFKARNGRSVGIQGDDGEMCWIVHSDDIEALRHALATLTDRERDND